jgi:DNA polymerase-3 subunit gamma/tau
VAASTEGHITYQSALDNLNVLDYDYYFRLVETFLAGDVMQALLIYKEIRDKGFDSQFFVNGLAQHLRDLMVASTPQTRKLLEMNDEVAQRYGEQSAKLAPAFYYRALDLCNTCDLNYRNASSNQLLVELTLVKLCQLVAPQAQQPIQPSIQRIATQPSQQPQRPAARQAQQPPVTDSAQQPPHPAEQPPHPADMASHPSQAAPAPRPVAHAQSSAPPMPHRLL